MVETFLDSTVADGADCIIIPGYSMCCRRDREGTSGCGLAVYCLDGIAIYHNPRRDPKDLELMWLTISLQSQKLLICAIYRPPSGNNDILEYLDTSALPKMIEFGAQSLMLVGDFNVHHQDWLGSRTTDSAGRLTLRLADCLGLHQIVAEPTRGEHILDLVMTDLPATTTTFAHLGTSDHNPVLVQLQVPVFRDKPYRRKVWSYDRTNFWDMRGHLSSVNWSGILNNNALRRHVPKLPRPFVRPWTCTFQAKQLLRRLVIKLGLMTSKCRHAAKRKHCLHRQLKKRNTPANKMKFTLARRKYNQAESPKPK